jgi:hypothetical protein
VLAFRIGTVKNSKNFLRVVGLARAMSAGTGKDSTDTRASSDSDIGARDYAKGSPLFVLRAKNHGPELRVATSAFVERLGDDHALKSRANARAFRFVALEPSLVGFVKTSKTRAACLAWLRIQRIQPSLGSCTYWSIRDSIPSVRSRSVFSSFFKTPPAIKRRKAQ